LWLYEGRLPCRTYGHEIVRMRLDLQVSCGRGNGVVDIVVTAQEVLKSGAEES